MSESTIIEDGTQRYTLQSLSARKLRELERMAEERCLPRQVAFCRHLVLGNMRQVDAYQAAGYESERPDVQSSKVMRKQVVKDLIAIYTETAKRAAMFSGQNLQIQVQDLINDAVNEGDRNGAYRGIELLAKMTGNMSPDKVEVKTEDVTKQPVAEPTREGLQAYFKARREADENHLEAVK